MTKPEYITPELAQDVRYTRFEVYSHRGRLMDACDDQIKAERRLGEWFSAKFVIGVLPGGMREVVAERQELN